jgi:hypothetical protein
VISYFRRFVIQFGSYGTIEAMLAVCRKCGFQLTVTTLHAAETFTCPACGGGLGVSHQDGVQPLDFDIADWRRVRLGLTCMRRAQFSVVGAVPLTFLLAVVAVILGQTGVVPGRQLNYLVELPLVLFFVGLIALFLCGLGYCCAAPSEFRIRQYAIAALVLGLVACSIAAFWILWQNRYLMAPWIVMVMRFRFFPELLLVMFGASVVLTITCVQLLIRSVAELLQRRNIINSVPAFIRWLLIWFGSGLLLLIWKLAADDNVVLNTVAGFYAFATTATMLILYCWQFVLFHDLDIAIELALKPRSPTGNDPCPKEPANDERAGSRS